MESLITRYRNVTVLVIALFIQVLALAVQVKRNVDNEPTRLIRVWTVRAVVPLEKSIVWFQTSTSNVWHNYIYLRGVRQENRDLKAEIERLRLEQVRLSEDAQQARRLQVLLGFKEMYISKTQPAQVIGSSGSEQSRMVYIDKGSDSGLAKDMAVITAEGVVGKVLSVDRKNAQVLLINDQSSGVGVLLEKSRVQGILKGTSAGETVLEKVMSDEQIQAGDTVLTSGGDQIFPKGLPVGTVAKVAPGQGFFLNIWVKPMARLNKLEEVLVITKLEERTPTVADGSPIRAVDILAQRLPSVPEKPSVAAPTTGTPAGTTATTSTTAAGAKPAGIDAKSAATTAPREPQIGTAPAQKPPAPTQKPPSGVVTNPSAPGQTPAQPVVKPKPGPQEPKPDTPPEDKPQ